jgi:Gamma-glutamyl cyclotransferase, AIG2-like
MLNEPGRGLRVHGELYEVENSRLASLDAIEHIGEPGNSRASIEVEPVEGGAYYDANVYFKARELANPVHTTYLEGYRDRRFVPPWSRRSACDIQSYSDLPAEGSNSCSGMPRSRARFNISALRPKF